MDEQTAFLMLLAQRLESLGIPYMVTGSVALTIYAEPRMTRDIDLVVDLRRPHVDRFVREFSVDCYVDPQTVLEAVSRRDMFNVIHNEWITKADFVVRKDDEYRVGELERRRVIRIGAVPVSVVAPEDLLLSKLVWGLSGSELQARDVRTLLASGQPIDWKYVEEWAERLGIGDALRAARRAD